MSVLREVLTVRDVALELRCSVARSNEQGDIDGMISPSKINAVRRIEEDLYA
jgi:hypothetical protein